MDRIEVINKLIKENGYESYLEIGFAGGVSFNGVKAKSKVAVDPAIAEKKPNLYGMTSDEYFKMLVEQENPHTYDVVFIDGLHIADQVRKDIINAAKFLSKNGAIVLHDVNPNSELTQRVPMETPIWEGDCWRAFVGFREKYPDVKTECYLEDHGIAVIHPNGKKFKAHFENMEMTYQEFEKNKEELLGVADF